MILTIIRGPSADYSVLLSSVYLQDEIRLSPKFNVLAGIRVDWQNTPTAFPISDQIKIRLSLQGIEINDAPIINPRVGFNYNIDDAKTC
jgi:outer membrane receptor protein involved in Fe transport